MKQLQQTLRQTPTCKYLSMEQAHLHSMIKAVGGQNPFLDKCKMHIRKKDKFLSNGDSIIEVHPEVVSLVLAPDQQRYHRENGTCPPQTQIPHVTSKMSHPPRRPVQEKPTEEVGLRVGVADVCSHVCASWTGLLFVCALSFPPLVSHVCTITWTT